MNSRAVLERGRGGPWKPGNPLLTVSVAPLARVVLGALGRLEQFLLPERPLRYSPVFIIGVPRSGTTLAHQLMTYCLDTCYFTNLAGRMRIQGIAHPPVVCAAWIASILGLTRRRQESFRSDYGRTRGWGNPSDSIMIWRHWFRDNRYVGAGEIPLERRRAIAKSVAWTEGICGRPFLDKATDNSVRIRALAEIFPRALFILCKRSSLAVAQSLYIARMREVAGGLPPGQTVFTKPKEYDSIREKELLEQACELVYYLEKNIREDLETVPAGSLLAVDYERLCSHPDEEIDRIAAFLNASGAPVKRLRRVSRSFDAANVRKIDPELQEKLRDCLEKLFGTRMVSLSEPDTP